MIYRRRRLFGKILPLTVACLFSRFVALAQTVAYTTDFETAQGYSLGSLHGQNGWTVSQGAANVVAGSNFSGTQGVTLTTASPQTILGRSFSEFTGQGVVFVDFYSKPAANATAADATQFDAESTPARFVKVGVSGEIFALNGNGSGGGSWIATGRTSALNGSDEATDWIRFTFRQDYTNKVWDLYVNGTMAAHGLGFRDNTKTALSQFSVQGGLGGATAFDYFYAANINPLFVDTDLDGIADEWEQRYFGTLSHGPTNDPGNVGRTIAASYQQSLSPWPAPAVGSNLQLWYRADLGVTKDGSDKVSRWTDLSGGGAHALQSVGAAQPLAVAGAVGSKPAVRFDGSATILRAAATDLVEGSDDVTVIVVAKAGSTQPAYADILDYDHTTAPSGGFVVQQNASSLNQYSMWWWNGNWQGISPTTSLAAGVPQILTIVKGGTTQAAYLNGTQSFSATVPATMQANAPRAFHVGGSAIGRYFNGDIAEVLVYNRALSAQERQQVEAALNDRYFDDDDTLPGSWEMQYLGTLAYGPTDDPGGVGRTLQQSYSQGLSPWSSPLIGSGLQAWYRADQGVIVDGNNKAIQWTDLSGNGAHAAQATAGSRPSAIAAAIGGKPALRFDGSATILRSGPTDLFESSNDVTVVIVANPGGTQQAYADILDYDHTTAPNGGFVIQQNGGSLNQYSMWWWNGDWQGITPTTAMATGTPQILTIVKGGTTQAAYLNGVQSSNATVPATMLPNAPRAFHVGGSAIGRYFNGDIAEVLVYNRALTSQERQQVEAALNNRYFDDSDTLPGTWEMQYFGTLAYGPNDDPGGVGRTLQQSYDQSLSPWPSPTVSSGLQLWYRADKGVSADGSNKVSQWTDLSGAGAHATQAVTAAQPSVIAAAIGGKPALRFDGSATLLRAKAADLFKSSNDITVVVVTNPGSSQQTYADILDYDHATPPYGGFVLQQAAASLNQHSLWWWNGDWQGLAPVTALTTGAAQVFTIVKGGTTQTNFVNGVQSSSATVPSTMQPNAPRPFYVGGSAIGRYFNGDIAEVRVYNRALTTQERTQLETAIEDRYLLYPAPATPAHFKATALSGTQTLLTWDAPAGRITDYVIERSVGSGSFAILAEPTGRTSFIDSGLTPGTQYSYRIRARNNVGSSANTTTLPVKWVGPGSTTELSLDGMRLWLRADALNPGGVATWRDQSGMERHATQGDVTKRPQVVDAVLNGRGVVRFDGTNDVLALGDVMSGATSGEAFVVLKAAADTPSSIRGLWRFGQQNLSRYPGTDGHLYDDFASDTQHDIGNPAPALDTFLLYNVAGGAGWSARSNGLLVQSASTNTPSFRTDPLIGSNGDYVFAGDIAEVIIYDRVLTAAEREKVGIYLTQRHALPGVTIPGSPANLAVAADSPTQVTITWSAPASGVGLVYTLERQLEDGAFVAIAEIVDQLTYTDSTITAGRPYSYRIKARTYAGTSAFSASVALAVPGDSDGDGVTDADEVTAGTNPVDRYNGRAFVLVTTSGPGAIGYTYDLSGRITGATVGEHGTLAFGFDAASNLTSATSTISNPTAIQAWRSSHSLPADGSGSGADGVILAGDGLPNLAKYAFGLVPQTTVTAAHPVISLATVSSSQHLALTYQRPDPAPPDVAYVVEVSSDGVAWNSGSGATVATGTVVNGGQADVTVRDATAVASPAYGRRIRLSIQRGAQP